MKTIASPTGLVSNQPIFEALRGQEVTRISLEQWSVRILFTRCSELIVECNWWLTDESGNMLDNNMEITSRTKFELWRLVGTTITDFERDPANPLIWSIRTTCGLHLAIVGDLDKYEDWSLVSPHQEYVLVSSGGEITKW